MATIRELEPRVGTPQVDITTEDLQRVGEFCVAMEQYIQMQIKAMQGAGGRLQAFGHKVLQEVVRERREVEVLQTVERVLTKKGTIRILTEDPPHYPTTFRLYSEGAPVTRINREEVRLITGVLSNWLDYSNHIGRINWEIMRRLDTYGAIDINVQREDPRE